MLLALSLVCPVGLNQRKRLDIVIRSQTKIIAICACVASIVAILIVLSCRLYANMDTFLVFLLQTWYLSVD